jgi:hypothetical protein
MRGNFKKQSSAGEMTANIMKIVPSIKGACTKKNKDSDKRSPRDEEILTPREESFMSRVISKSKRDLFRPDAEDINILDTNPDHSYLSSIKESIKELDNQQPCSECCEMKFSVAFPKGKKYCYDCRNARKSPRKTTEDKEYDSLYEQVSRYLCKMPPTLDQYQVDVNDINSLFHMTEKLYIPINEFRLYGLYETHSSEKENLTANIIQLKIALYLAQHKGVKTPASDLIVKYDTYEKRADVILPDSIQLTYPEVIQIRKFVKTGI